MLLKTHGDTLWRDTASRGLNKRLQAALLFAGCALIWILIFSPFRPNLFSGLSPDASASHKSPYAYVTLLSQNPKLDNTTIPDDEDEYFVAARVLAYQLLHAPATRTNTSIPFVVLATPDIAQSKVDRLRKDGATVRIVEKISEKWFKPGLERWRDVMTKLRIWELTQYDKVLCLDLDMLIIRRLDGIFTDSTTEPLRVNTELAKDDEGPMPKSYIFSAQTYMEGRVHPYPPKESNFLAVGFFVCQPSISIFNYYMSIAKIEGRFDSNAPEQGLLNYAHRRGGPMPWTEIYYQWTTTWPSMKEYEAGAATLHEKWWDKKIPLDPELRKLWETARADMFEYQKSQDMLASLEG